MVDKDTIYMYQFEDKDEEQERDLLQFDGQLTLVGSVRMELLEEGEAVWFYLKQGHSK